MAIHISWTKGVDKELVQDIRGNFAEALVMRRRLKEMLLDKVETSQRVNREKSAYDNPNWAYLQADSRGYERAMHEILSLISENT